MPDIPWFWVGACVAWALVGAGWGFAGGARWVNRKWRRAQAAYPHRKPPTGVLGYNEKDAVVIAEAFARWILRGDMAQFAIQKPHAFVIGAIAQLAYIQGDDLPPVVRERMREVALLVQDNVCDTPELYNMFEAAWRKGENDGTPASTPQPTSKPD